LNRDILDDPARRGVLATIRGLLRPDGWFLDYDLFFDGVEPHLNAMREAGFVSVECRWQESPRAIVAAGRE